MRLKLVRFVVFIGCALTARSIGAAEYRATVLHPIGFASSAARAATGDYQVGSGRLSNQPNHALMWQGTADSVVDLHPAGYFASELSGATLDSQLGNAAIWVGNDLIWKAHIWKGSADSAIDVHPDGLQYSDVTDAFENTQVGGGYGPTTGGRFNALLWRGTRESVVNLHPAGFIESFAFGVDAEVQTGSVRKMIGGPSHAVIWRSSAASFVDLHPASYATSHAWDIEGDIVAGSAIFPATNEEHAMVWNLTTKTFVDLNPASWRGSEIRAIAGGFQVGFGWHSAGQARSHAMVWRGTAESAVDLHFFLPTGTEYIQSNAIGVSANGDIVGAAETTSGQFHAVKWSIVPEPSIGQLVVSMTLMGTLLFRRRYIDLPRYPRNCAERSGQPRARSRIGDSIAVDAREQSLNPLPSIQPKLEMDRHILDFVVSYRRRN